MAVARPTMCWEESSVLVTPQGQTARDQLPLGQCLLAFAVPSSAVPFGSQVSLEVWTSQ